jgi:hypothetical protein
MEEVNLLEGLMGRLATGVLRGPTGLADIEKDRTSTFI